MAETDKALTPEEIEKRLKIIFPDWPPKLPAIVFPPVETKEK